MWKNNNKKLVRKRKEKGGRQHVLYMKRVEVRMRAWMGG